MTDFAVIPEFERWVYAENARALEFLDRDLRRGDVVVTHHLPAESSVADPFGYATFELNPKFDPGFTVEA